MTTPMCSPPPERRDSIAHNRVAINLVVCKSFRVEPDLLLDEQLCFALYAASRTATGSYREALAQLGLTYTQFVTMLALW